MSSQDWELYVEGNALIAEFGADIDTDAETFAAVNERFEELAARDGVDAHVSVLRMESPLSSDVFAKAQEAAAVGTEYGIHTWVLVADRIKRMAMQDKVGEIEGVELQTADSVEEAVELVSA